MKSALLLAALSLFATPAFADWSCFAEDRAYGYEAIAADKREAEEMAVDKCRERSDRPGLCAFHRCGDARARARRHARRR